MMSSLQLATVIEEAGIPGPHGAGDEVLLLNAVEILLGDTKVLPI